MCCSGKEEYLIKSLKNYLKLETLTDYLRLWNRPRILDTAPALNIWEDLVCAQASYSLTDLHF